MDTKEAGRIGGSRKSPRKSLTSRANLEKAWAARREKTAKENEQPTALELEGK